MAVVAAVAAVVGMGISGDIDEGGGTMGCCCGCCCVEGMEAGEMGEVGEETSAVSAGPF